MIKIEKITGEQLKEAVNDLYHDMRGCLNTTKLIESVRLPDGRKAQIHISMEADEDNFISED